MFSPIPSLERWELTLNSWRTVQPDPWWPRTSSNRSCQEPVTVVELPVTGTSGLVATGSVDTVVVTMGGGGGRKLVPVALFVGTSERRQRISCRFVGGGFLVGSLVEDFLEVRWWVRLGIFI